MGLLKFNFAKHHWRIKNEASVQPLVEKSAAKEPHATTQTKSLAAS